MKKGNKHKHKQAVPTGSKPGPAPQRPLKSQKPKQEAVADRAARQELRKQEKAQCAVQCKKYIKRVQESLLQPSRKHYGGLGYAKESIFVHLDDPDYAERFQEIWDEHIPGFSGKSFKKRKSEAAENMLWRQRLKARQEGTAAPSVEVFLDASVRHADTKAKRPNKAAAAEPAGASKQKPQSARKQATAGATVEPDLQAQVMAAYRNMKLKQRESAKKPPSRRVGR